MTHAFLRRCLLLLSLLALIALSAPGVTPASAADEQRSGTVSPAQGGPGTTFTFTAEFEKDENIGYWLTAPDGTVVGDYTYGFDVKRSGSVSWSWTAPDDALPGAWRLTARPINGTFSRQVIIPFTISGTPPPAAAEISGSPASGPGGTVFTFQATGLQPGEIASFWATTPDGVVLSDPAFLVYVDQYGAGQWTWRAPDNAAPGLWLMVVQGRESKIQRALRFRIDAGGTVPAPPAGTAGSATPASGAPGTTFTIVIGGFSAGELVSYWASSPDGQALGAADYMLNADDDGRVTITWTAPANATRGPWMMVGYGNDSRRTLTTSFSIS